MCPLEPISQRQPLMFLLVSLIACSDAEENHEPPFTATTLGILMAIAGMCALTYGVITGVVPW